VTADLLLGPVPLGALAVAIIAAGAWWLDHANGLRLSLFRPYRADPWPHGVQEEDVVSWRWTPSPAEGEDEATTATVAPTPVATTRLHGSVGRADHR